MEQLSAGVVLLLAVAAVALVVAWVVLPFAIIGTKPLLRELLAEVRTQNQLLRQAQAAPPAAPGAAPAGGWLSSRG